MSKATVPATRRRRSTSNVTCSPAELGALYQAAFEAGYAAGRAAAVKEPCDAGCAPSAHSEPATAAPAEHGSRNLSRHMFGLPCANCGAYFSSDDTCCPCCGHRR